MGPYCKFCNNRCFVPFPNDAPADARAAYQGIGHDIIATCQDGQKFERLLTGGWCYDRIKQVTSAADYPHQECDDCDGTGMATFYACGMRYTSMCMRCDGTGQVPVAKDALRLEAEALSDGTPHTDAFDCQCADCFERDLRTQEAIERLEAAK